MRESALSSWSGVFLNTDVSQHITEQDNAKKILNFSPTALLVFAVFLIYY